MADPAEYPDIAFEGQVWCWRGPAPYYFVRVPPEQGDELVELAAEVTYGWGMVPVEVTIADRTWETSLWPKDGGYLLPLKARIRRDLGLDEDDVVAVRLLVVSRAGRPIDPTTGAPRRNRGSGSG